MKKEFPHLPSFMQDFHDQKELFKAIHATEDVDDPDHYPDWVKAHCYTTDIFLNFMFRHGYTLQKSKANYKFHDLDQTLKDFRKERAENFQNLFKPKEEDEGGE